MGFMNLETACWRNFEPPGAACVQTGSLTSLSTCCSQVIRQPQQSRCQIANAVMAISPNIKWHITLAPPLTRTVRPPK